MRILPLIVIVACLACQVLARPQEDTESRASPPRGLLKRGPPNKGKTTTTTTPAAAQEESEYEDDGEYEAAAGEAQEPSTEATPSSTEGKKVLGGVRPFRSNTDLLETLKRRRAQAAEARHSAPAASQSHDVQADAPSKANYNKKRPNAATPEDAPVPSKAGKSRFGRPSSSKASLETEREEQIESTPSPRTGRTFARRGN